MDIIIFSEKSKSMVTDNVNIFKNLETERAKCKRPGVVSLSDFQKKKI